MSCPSWQQAILERIAGDLDGPQAEAVDRHLAACPACRRAAGSWQRLADETLAAAQAPAPAPALALAKVRRARRDEARGLLAWAWPWRRLGWAGVGLLAGALAMLRWAGTDVAPPRAEHPGPSRGAVGGGQPPGSAPFAGLVPNAPDGYQASRRAPTGPRTAPEGAGSGRPISPNPDAGAGRVAAFRAVDRPGAPGAGRAAAAPALAAWAPATASPPPSPAAVLEPDPSASGPQPDDRPRSTAVPSPPPALPTAGPTPSEAPAQPSVPASPTAAPRRSGLARVAGRVLDPAGAPVPLALVYLRPADGDAAWGLLLTDTDEAGAFSLDLPPGRWQLWVEADGSAPVHYVDEPVLDLGLDGQRLGIVVHLPAAAPVPPSPTAGNVAGPGPSETAPSAPTATVTPTTVTATSTPTPTSNPVDSSSQEHAP